MLSRLYTLLLVVVVAWSSWAAFDGGWKGLCACALFLAFQVRLSDIRRFTLLDAILCSLVIWLLLSGIKPSYSGMPDNDYFHHETPIVAGMRHVDDNEDIQLNWSHCIGLPIYLVSVALLLHQAWRSRRKVGTSDVENAGTV